MSLEQALAEVEAGAVADTLERLAEFVRANPSWAAALSGESFHLCAHSTDEWAIRFAELDGSDDTTDDGMYLVATRNFGVIDLQLYADKDDVPEPTARAEIVGGGVAGRREAPGREMSSGAGLATEPALPPTPTTGGLDRALLIDGNGRSLHGRCGHCQRRVDNHDELHRVSAILQGGRGVECVLRGDIVHSDAMPLGHREAAS